MKKIIVTLTVVMLVVVVVVVVGFGVFNYISNKDGSSRVKNEKAEKDTQTRYLTIINDTKQVINEVSIVVGEGTEIEQSYQEKPDENSFSVEIP